MDRYHDVLAKLVCFGYGNIINEMTLEEMGFHYLEARNDAELAKYQSLGIDNDENPFYYPFGYR